MCPVCAIVDSSGASGMVALKSGLMMWPLATLTLGPCAVGMMLVQIGVAVVSR